MKKRKEMSVEPKEGPPSWNGEKGLHTVIFSLFDTADLYEYQKGKSKKKSHFNLVFTEKRACDIKLLFG